MTKTRVGMMKMILKCVLSVGEQVLKDGVLNVVLTCRERAEQSVHPTRLRRSEADKSPKIR